MGTISCRCRRSTTKQTGTGTGTGRCTLVSVLSSQGAEGDRRLDSSCALKLRLSERATNPDFPGELGKLSLLGRTANPVRLLHGQPAAGFGVAP